MSAQKELTSVPKSAPTLPAPTPAAVGRATDPATMVGLVQVMPMVNFNTM